MEYTGGNKLKTTEKGKPDMSQVKPKKRTERPNDKDRMETGHASVEERQIVEIEQTFAPRWEW